MAACCCGATTTGGCGDDDSGDAVAITIAAAATGDDCAAATPPQSVAALGAASLRFTVSLRKSDGSRDLVCDELVDLASDMGVHALSLDTSAGDRMDLLVEAFDDAQPPHLLARGAVLGINRRPRLEPLAVLLSRAGVSTCTPTPLGAARAFHSATALPNGEALLVGGVASAEGAGFSIESSIEIYDPGTGQFRIAEGDLPEGRAFHSAVLLDWPSDQSAFDLLLVGGVAASASGEPAIAIGSDADALPFVPLASTSAASSVIVRYYPWTDPPQVQQMASSPSLLARLFHAVAEVGDETLIAGGIRAPETGLAQTGDDLEAISPDAAHRGPFPLVQPRIGAAAARLTDDAMLVFGGNLLSAPADLTADAAEVVTIAAGESTLASFEPESVALLRPVAHATLTPVADGLLLAGGLQIESGRAMSVLADGPAIRVAQVGDSLRLEEVTSIGFAGAAYHAAARLPDGDILLVGGMPPGCAVPCTSDLVARYSTSNREIGAEAVLRSGRLGHSATVLESGTVLVSGGLTSGPTLLPGAELLTPTPGVAAIDEFGRRAGEVAGPGCQ